jgi:hypothetical protein
VRWWSIKGHDREVSRSMVALAASLAAAAALGLTGWVPALLQQDTGVTSVQPSRLTVTAAARGAATLGDGYTVGLSSAGFRYAKGDVVMADTVTRGAPVIALFGSLTGPADEPREDIADTLDRITFTDLEVGRDGASWHGRIEGEVEGTASTPPSRSRVPTASSSRWTGALPSRASSRVCRPATCG